jgi:hypothetical protein
MQSDEPGGRYSAVLKDLMARRAALNSAITKLQAPQARSNTPSTRVEVEAGQRPGSASIEDSKAI